MALPRLSSLEECADYAAAVEPLLGQLERLPSEALAVVAGRVSLSEFYLSTNPLVSGLGFSVLLGFVFLAVSEFNRNYSQVDRMWSLLPTIYNAHFVAWSHLNGLPSQRLDLVLAWSVLWSIRLTFNYWRRGGYQVGSEDYRWEIVRDNIHPFFFFLLNVTFISFIQSVLLFLLAAPTYVILLAAQFEPEINGADCLFFAIQVGLVVSEWFSDGQQYDYQEAKKKYQATAKVPNGKYSADDFNRGFNVFGLWAYSRHPNFAAEQAIWLDLYQWSAFATKSLYHWAGAGSLFLVMLFQGSTWLTERITAGKYPEYKHYQQRVGMFIPSLQPYRAPPPTPRPARTADFLKGKPKQR